MLTKPLPALIIGASYHIAAPTGHDSFASV